VSDTNITLFLILATFVVIFVVFVSFWAFSSFLTRERARGERFKEMHLKPPDER
jgi:hypothetical protein